MHIFRLKIESKGVTELSWTVCAQIMIYANQDALRFICTKLTVQR